MISIQQLCSQLIELIGKETLCRELEGILRKHQGIAHRTRKPGRTDRSLSAIQIHLAEGAYPTPQMIARIVLQYNLSPASVYRLVRILRQQGLELRAVDVLREKERQKAGIY
jgi:hypothetical protein